MSEAVFVTSNPDCAGCRSRFECSSYGYWKTCANLDGTEEQRAEIYWRE